MEICDGARETLDGLIAKGREALAKGKATAVDEAIDRAFESRSRS